MLFENVLQAIGNTPLIKIKGFTSEEDGEIFAKAECFNVGGSIKTRTAFNMIRDAESHGKLKNGSHIVEISSGNQGVGLALVGAVLGYKVTVIMPDSVSEERRKIIKSYGAKVLLVKDNNDIGKCVEDCFKLAMEMKKADKSIFIPDQFSNEANCEAHEKFTAKEIIDDLNGNIDGFCVGIGSGGSITGIGRALKKINPNVEIWAVEPENSAVLSGGKRGSHFQMGIGDGIIPEILDVNLISNIIKVSDEMAINSAKMIARTNGLLCGITSGSNLIGSILLAKKLGKGKRVVTVFPDTGERYFSTPLFAR